jgi:hypothetical protein
MEDITKTYTIQWVGPFTSLEALSRYTKDDDTCSSDLFNFYYFVGRRNEKWSRKDVAYFGIHHKTDGITKRLNTRHEHLSKLRKDEHLKIWIGSFSDSRNQLDQNIEEVETVFIRAYKELLSENDRKKHKELTDLQDSICIINLWYKTNEQPWCVKPQSVKGIDDVLICEVDSKSPRILSANLKRKK